MTGEIEGIVLRLFQVGGFRVPHRRIEERMARHTYCYLCRRFVKTGDKPMTFKEIGQDVGRAYCTVISSCRVVENTLMRDPKYGRMVKGAIEQVKRI